MSVMTAMSGYLLLKTLPILSSVALVGTGFEVAVPLFVETGDKIEIDTRTHEYRKRV